MKTLTILLLITSLGAMGQTTLAFDSVSFGIMPKGWSPTVKLHVSNRFNTSFTGCIEAPFTSLEIKDSYGNTVLKVDTIGNDLKWEFKTILTLEDLIEYEKECYNDSLNRELYYWSAFGTCEVKSIECINMNTGERYTEHFRDPTFKGFVIWLKAKYKIN